MRKTAIGLLLVSIIAASACKKNPPAGQPDAAQLTVQLDGIYLQPDQVDSATIYWKEGALKTTKRLVKNGNKLSISLDSLANAAPELEIRVYTTKRTQSAAFVFAQKLVKPVSKNTSIVRPGPTSLNDQAWLPRAMMIDQGVHITFIMGIRPEDPYFSYSFSGDQWKDIEVHKGYYKGINGVAGNTWFCLSNACLPAGGIYENTATFRSIPEQIAGREYNHVEIAASFGTGNYRDGWRVLQFNYDF